MQDLPFLFAVFVYSVVCKLRGQMLTCKVYYIGS